MLNSVKERLIAFLEYKGINKSEFGRRIGVSNAFVTSMRKSIQPDKIALIQKEFPDLNTSWLLTGEGDMLKPKKQEKGGNARMLGGVFPVGYKDDEVIMVDFIPVSATATFIESLSSGNMEEMEKYPIVPRGNERDDYDDLKVIEVEGDSMFPTIPSRALILGKWIPRRSWHYAEGVIVAVFNEYVVAKRVAKNRLNTDNYIVLSSDNEEYGDMTVALADIRALYQAKRIISADIR